MAVAAVNVSTGQDGVDSSGSATSIIVSANITSGASSLIVVVCSQNNSTNVSPSGVTYNTSNNLTKVTSSDSNQSWYGGQQLHTSIWYLNNPPTGSALDIEATWASAPSGAIGLGWASFSGTDTTPCGTASINSSGDDSTLANPSVTVSDYTAGEYLIGVMACGEGTSYTFTADHSGIDQWGSSTYNLQMAYEYRGGTGDTVSWSQATDTRWAASAVAILAAAGGSGSWLTRNFWWENI